MPRKPSLRQREILAGLCRVAREQGTDEVKYVSEWLGYLPFGAYHWIEIGEDHSAERALGTEWGSRDLDALESAGWLELVSHEERDEFDSTTIYRITPAGQEAGAALEGERKSGAAAAAAAPEPERAPEPDPPRPTRALPAARLIPGTAATDAGEVPFVFDPATGRLTAGYHWPDRKPSTATRPQLASLAQAVRRELKVDLDRVRVGELRCRHCHGWFDLLQQPDAWSYGMCLSCSMDLSHDLAGD